MIIYAAVKPIEEYMVTVDGYALGIYGSYRDQPELLALIFLITPIPFDYEGDKPIEERRVSFTPQVEEALKATLESELEGKAVKEHIRTLNPLEFNSLIVRQTKLSLPVVDVLLKGEEGALRLIVGVRAAAWAINYRGKIASSGKVLNVAFRGIPVPEDMRIKYNQLKREFSK